MNTIEAMTTIEALAERIYNAGIHAGSPYANGGALALAYALCAPKPCAALAVHFGITNNTYYTPSAGWVGDYEGTAIVTMANGERWLATGHRPEGCPEFVTRDGGVTFRRLPDAE